MNTVVQQSMKKCSLQSFIDFQIAIVQEINLDPVKQLHVLNFVVIKLKGY